MRLKDTTNAVKSFVEQGFAREFYKLVISQLAFLLFLLKGCTCGSPSIAPLNEDETLNEDDVLEAGRLVVSPFPNIVFTCDQLGCSETKTITLENRGDGPLELSSVEMAASVELVLSSEVGLQNVIPSAPLTLEAGESFDATLTYNPKDDILDDRTLSFSWVGFEPDSVLGDAPARTATTTLNIVTTLNIGEPSIEIVNAEQNLGYQPVGANALWSIQVRNTSAGQRIVGIHDIEIPALAGLNANVLSELPAFINQGEVFELDVEVEVETEGLFDLTALVSSQTSQQALDARAALTSQENAEFVVLEPSDFELKWLTPMNLGERKEVRVQNVGNSAIQLELSLNDDSHFSIALTENTIELMPLETASIPIVYNPGAELIDTMTGQVIEDFASLLLEDESLGLATSIDLFGSPQGGEIQVLTLNGDIEVQADSVAMQTSRYGDATLQDILVRNLGNEDVWLTNIFWKDGNGTSPEAEGVFELESLFGSWEGWLNSALVPAESETVFTVKAQMLNPESDFQCVSPVGGSAENRSKTLVIQTNDAFSREFEVDFSVRIQDCSEYCHNSLIDGFGNLLDGDCDGESCRLHRVSCSAPDLVCEPCRGDDACPAGWADADGDRRTCECPEDPGTTSGDLGEDIAAFAGTAYENESQSSTPWYSGTISQFGDAIDIDRWFAGMNDKNPFNGDFKVWAFVRSNSPNLAIAYHYEENGNPLNPGSHELHADGWIPWSEAPEFRNGEYRYVIVARDDDTWGDESGGMTLRVSANVNAPAECIYYDVQFAADEDASPW